MKSLLVAGLVALAGCYSPKVKSGGFTCSTTDSAACPSGFSCVDGYCVDRGGPGAPGDLSASGASDLAAPATGDLASTSANDLSSSRADLSSSPPPDMTPPPPPDMTCHPYGYDCHGDATCCAQCCSGCCGVFGSGLCKTFC